MSTAEKRHYTVEEYLEFERTSGTKHEYYQGEIFAMVGASPAHNRIVWNLSRFLGNQLDGTPCEGFANDMRVKVERTGLYTYPDVAIACGEAKFEKQVIHSLLNPTLIIEVLSNSTANYDRVEKFAQYQTIDSFQQYVLVSQKEYHVEVFTKQSDGQWPSSSFRGLDAKIELGVIGCTLALSDVYRRVEIPEREESPSNG